MRRALLAMSILSVMLYSCANQNKNNQTIAYYNNIVRVYNPLLKIEGAFVTNPYHLVNYPYKYIILIPFPYDTINDWVTQPNKVRYLLRFLNKNSFLMLNLGSGNWYGEKLHENTNFIEKQKSLIRQIYKSFGDQIGGIYIPQEENMCNCHYSINNYYMTLYNYAKQYGYKVMIAPFWNGCPIAKFAQCVESIKNCADIIALQDGVASRGWSPQSIEPYLQQFKYILGEKAWIDLEAFKNPKDLYTTIYQDKNLYNRVIQQIGVDSKYATHIIAFSYLNLIRTR